MLLTNELNRMRSRLGLPSDLRMEPTHFSSTAMPAAPIEGAEQQLMAASAAAAAAGPAAVEKTGVNGGVDVGVEGGEEESEGK